MTTQSVALAVAAVAVLMALVPLAWAYRQRGPRRDRSREGRVDGLLLLATFLLAVFAVAMSVVATARVLRERREIADSRPVTLRLEQCWVGSQRTGGRTGGTSYDLTCHATDVRNGQVLDTIRAGSPGSRSSYDEWVTEHPPGSAVTLRRMVQPPAQIVGFEHLVPSTRTAAHASGRAFGFALVALVAFLLSRLLVRRRHP